VYTSTDNANVVMTCVLLTSCRYCDWRHS